MRLKKLYQILIKLNKFILYNGPTCPYRHHISFKFHIYQRQYLLLLHLDYIIHLSLTQLNLLNNRFDVFLILQLMKFIELFPRFLFILVYHLVNYPMIKKDWGFLIILRNILVETWSLYFGNGRLCFQLFEMERRRNVGHLDRNWHQSLAQADLLRCHLNFMVFILYVTILSCRCIFIGIFLFVIQAALIHRYPDNIPEHLLVFFNWFFHFSFAFPSI